MAQVLESIRVALPRKPPFDAVVLPPDLLHRLDHVKRDPWPDCIRPAGILPTLDFVPRWAVARPDHAFDPGLRMLDPLVQRFLRRFHTDDVILKLKLLYHLHNVL